MDRSNCRYAPYYCEENVYYLCRRFAASPELRASAVFISNTGRQCAMTYQRSGGSRMVVWDYHVVLGAILGSGRAVIYDLDTLLPFPFDARGYVARSFPAGLTPEYQPIFRVVPGRMYLSSFASDRRHMRRADGSFLAAPPEWPPIRGEEGSNLEDFIDMNRTGFGSIVGRARLADVLEGVPDDPRE